MHLLFMKHPLNNIMDNQQMLKQIGNAIFIISPLIGYIPQIAANNIVFSPLLSLVLIISAIMRIFFFRYEKYGLPILFQSFALILTQLYLVYKFKHKLGIVEDKFYKKFKTDNRAIFTKNLVLISSVYLLCHLTGYFSMDLYKFCGIIGAVLESSVGVLQIYFRRMDKRFLIGEDKRRIPKELFACWIVGDVVKAFWIYVLNAKKIFLVPIMFQIIVDCFLMFE